MRALVLVAVVALSGCITATTDDPSSPSDFVAYDGYRTAEDVPQETESRPEENEPAEVEEPEPTEPTPEEPPKAPEEESEPTPPTPPPSKWRKPVARPLPADLTGLTHVTHAAGTDDGAGITLFGQLAFVGDTGGPVHIVDISSPEQPQHLATLGAPARDLDTIWYPDDRLILVSTGGGREMVFSDVTEPTDPVVIGTVTTPHNNHNLAVVPGTPIVYNSPSGGRYTDIIDASDPANPVVVAEWENGAGCHDITFHITDTMRRGYCAGIDDVQIWNLDNPVNPYIITAFNWPTAGQHDSSSVYLVSFAHLAIVNHDASVLILGDETGGGAAPGCDVYAHAAGQTVSGPLGNLYFYDITDEKRPQIRGHMSVSATDATLTCTAHFGRTIADRDDLVMAFYTAGVVLVNFTDLDNPRMVDQWRVGNIWDVQYYQGYAFTGGMNRGLDVLTFA